MHRDVRVLSDATVIRLPLHRPLYGLHRRQTSSELVYGQTSERDEILDRIIFKKTGHDEPVFPLAHLPSPLE